MSDYYLPGEERFGRVTSVVYDLLSRLPSVRRFYDFVVDDMTTSEGADVLDVGSGTGTVAIRLAKSGRFGMVYGIDPSKAMVSIAKRRARGVNGVDFELGSSRHIPFERKFDIIMSSLSFHHWDSRAHALRHLSYYLKRRGEIRVYEFSAEKMGVCRRMLIPSHAVRKYDIYRVAKESGLKIREVIETDSFIRAVFIAE